MATESERVTIRLSKDQLEKLELLVEDGKFSSKSDAIRAAIDKFLETEDVPPNIAKMTIALPKGNVIDLEQIVDSGDSISVDDAIRHAVREYIRTRLERMLARYEAQDIQAD